MSKKVNTVPEKITTVVEQSEGNFAEFSAVVAFLLAAATITSFCYRVGYFLSIDKKLLQFLSLSDTVPSSAHLVAWTLISLILGMA